MFLFFTFLTFPSSFYASQHPASSPEDEAEFEDVNNSREGSPRIESPSVVIPSAGETARAKNNFRKLKWTLKCAAHARRKGKISSLPSPSAASSSSSLPAALCAPAVAPQLLTVVITPPSPLQDPEVMATPQSPHLNVQPSSLSRRPSLKEVPLASCDIPRAAMPTDNDKNNGKEEKSSRWDCFKRCWRK